MTTATARPPGHCPASTPADVCLLAELNVLHATCSGLATRKLFERAYTGYSNAPEVIATPT